MPKKRYLKFRPTILPQWRVVLRVFLGIIAIGIVSFLTWKFVIVKPVVAGWFDDSWLYRVKIEITNSGSNQTDFQVSFTLDTATLITASKMQGDCDDIRVTDANGLLLTHWIETNDPGCNNAATQIWIKHPSVTTGGVAVYVYYGNSQAANIQDGSQVFPFFDDFANFDNGKWTATGAYSLASGEITITTGSVYSNDIVIPEAQNYMFETRRSWVAASGTYSGMSIADAQSTQTSNLGSNKLIYYMTQDASLSVRAWVATGISATYNIIASAAQYTATATTDYLDSFSMDGTSVRYYNNRTLTNTYTGTWSAAPYMFLGYFLGSASTTEDVRDVTIDWVLVRKFATTEPSAGAAGTEEKAPGPIAWWKMDEGADNTCSGGTNDVCDSSGNENDGAISGATWQTEDKCVSGKCLYFDGTNDVVTVSNTVSGIQTVSFWVKVQSTSTTQELIDLNGTDYLTSVSGAITATQFGTETIYVDGQAGKTSITANNWHYVTVTTTSGLSGSAIKIGQVSTNYGQAFIDGVRIYPYVRTAAQVKADFVRGAGGTGSSAVLGAQSTEFLNQGLVGYWPMDETWPNQCTGGANDTCDKSGNGDDGAWNGDVATASGKFANGITFDGTGDFVRFGSMDTISFSNQGASVNPDINDGSNCTDPCSYSNTSWTPPTSGIILVFVMNRGNSAGEAVPPTVTGNNLTWTQIATLDHPSTNDIVTLFAANASGSSAGVTTFSFGSNLQLNLNAQFFSATGVDVSGGAAAAFVQSPTNSGSGTSGSVVLSAAASSDNRPIASFYHAANEITAERAAWTEVDDQNGLGPTRGVETQWRSDAFEASASASWVTSANWSGIAAELKAGTTSSIDNVDNFTLAVWVNPSTSVASKAIMVKNNEIRLVTDASGYPICQIHNGTSWQTAATGNVALSLNSWQQVGCTYDQKTLRVFVNGSQTANQAMTETVANTTNVWEFGRDSGGTYGAYNGKMDDIRIFNRALSGSEVASLYNWAPGPVGWWKMDEGNWSGTSGEVADSSGNNNNGTRVGNATTTVGKVGNGGTFDGNGDYVNVPDTSTLDLTSGVTLAAWVNFNVTTAYDAIIGKREGAVRSYMLERNSLTNEYLFELTGVAAPSSTSTIETGVWKHVAATWSVEDGEARIYVNGVLENSDDTTATSLTTNDSPVNFGRTGSQAAYPFNGKMDDVRIYNYARTQKQIVQDMNAGHPSVGSPVGYWRFDEGYGDTTYNLGSGGTALNGDLAGTCPGGATCPTWNNDGKFDKALNFDGTDDSLSITDGTSSPLDLTTSLTFSVWINPGVTNVYDEILSKIPAAYGSGYELSNSSGAVRTTLRATAGICDFTSGSLTANTWQHVVSTYDGTNIRHYINGVLKGVASSCITGAEANNESFFIGRRASDNSWFTGRMDEVKIYNYSLTDDEVKMEYNQGKSLVLGALSQDSSNTASYSASTAYCVPGDTTTCRSPVGEWKMDENAGTSVNDSSGYGNGGTISGNPVWAPGRAGSALSFDGTTDYVNIGDIAVLEPTAVTISLWAKTTDFNRSLNGGVAKGFVFGSGTEYSYKLNFNQGSVSASVAVADTHTAITQISIGDNNWHYWVYTYDGAQGVLYKDGVAASTVAGSGSIDYSQTNNNFVIGARSNGVYSFDGLLDQIRVYDYARTPAQVAWEYNKGGPVAWYKFDECEGTSVYNTASASASPVGTIVPGASGNTSAGTCTSGTSTHMWYNGASGKYSASLDFDGTDDYVYCSEADCGGTSKLDGNGTNTTGWTVSAWFNMSTAGTTGDIAGKSSGNGGVGYVLERSSGNKICMYFENTGPCSVTTLGTGTWYHGVGVYDGTTVKIYLNGLLENSVGYSSGVTDTTAQFVIGARNNSGSSHNTYFDGQIDDVKIFNYALTPVQVKTDYNQGSAVRFGPVTGTP